MYYIIHFCYVYSWASIPLMYPTTYFFSIPSSAFVALACLNVFIGIVTTLSTYILELFTDQVSVPFIVNFLKSSSQNFNNPCIIWKVLGNIFSLAFCFYHMMMFVRNFVATYSCFRTIAHWCAIFNSGIIDM